MKYWMTIFARSGTTHAIDIAPYPEGNFAITLCGLATNRDGEIYNAPDEWVSPEKADEIALYVGCKTCARIIREREHEQRRAQQQREAERD